MSSGFGSSTENLYVMELSDYGLPAAIEPPPAAEVIERQGFSTVDAGIL